MYTQVLEVRILPFLMTNSPLTTGDMNLAELKEEKEHSKHMLL